MGLCSEVLQEIGQYRVSSSVVGGLTESCFTFDRKPALMAVKGLRTGLCS